MPEKIAVMADKRYRSKTILDEGDFMEVNRVNSTSFPPVNSVAEAKLYVPPEMAQAVKAVNGAKLFGLDSELSFAMDRESKRLVVRLVDKKTRHVIRQIPAEEVLRQAASLPKP
jgi:flagellar protein FlaG